MDFDFFGIFTLVTGILFLILEIRQSNWMWLFQFLSSAAAMVSFLAGNLYASAALNLYYVVMAFVGFVQWRRDERLGTAAGGQENASDGQGGAAGIHLRHLSSGTAAVSLLVFVSGTASLFFLLRFLGDPKSVLDAGATVLSAVATWWLAKSYPQQWLLWIVADAVSAWLCWEQCDFSMLGTAADCLDISLWKSVLKQGWFAMGMLYVIYAASAIYGYVHWMRKGKYIA